MNKNKALDQLDELATKIGLLASTEPLEKKRIYASLLRLVNDLSLTVVVPDYLDGIETKQQQPLPVHTIVQRLHYTATLLARAYQYGTLNTATQTYMQLLGLTTHEIIQALDPLESEVPS